MNPNKPITNPMLCGTIELLKAENTPEHKKMFVDEMIRATYLSPVVIDPVPQPDETGKVKITSENKVQFPMISAKDGKKFFMAFTDWEELKKWNPSDNQQTFAMKFDDYAGMLLRKDKDGNPSPGVGFVINPYSSNVLVTNGMIAQIIEARLAQKGFKFPKVPPKTDAEAAQTETAGAAEGQSEE